MKSHKIVPVFAVALLLAIPAAKAQQAPQQPQGQQTPDNPQTGQGATPLPPLTPAGGDNANANRPVPTARGIFLGADVQPADSTQAQPDRHVLADNEAFGVGSLTGKYSVFDPALHFTESADTGIQPGTINTVTAFGGSLSLDQYWNRTHLTVFYDGADTLYRPTSSLDTFYQNFAIAPEFRWRRWILRFRDSLLVSPQAGLSGLDTGGPGLLGQVQIPTTTVSSAVPGETILTANALRLTNSSSSDLDYEITRRTTVTFAGSYDLLHFFNGGYINSHQYGARGGLNYDLDPKDSIAVIYSYSLTDFDGTNSQVVGNLAQLAFGRKVTGRLAFQVAAGPQYISLHNFGAASGSVWSWGAFAAVTYNLPRTTLGLIYLHGVNAGSGVFLGSETHALTATVNHNFTRYWSGSLNGGYSLNNNLAPSPGTITQFNVGSAGATLRRQLGRYIVASLGYEYQQQFSASGTCPVASCGITTPRHLASIAVDWHMRAVAVE